MRPVKKRILEGQSPTKRPETRRPRKSSANGTTIERYCRTAELVQPEIEAATLFALIDGLAQHYVLDPENYPLEAVTEAVVARYNK